jgi:hypothetical protein
MAGRPPGQPKTGGRKPGVANVKTRQLADKAATEGITPLEVLILDMRQKYEAGDLTAAADRARDCAPYMHPRLSSANVQVRRIESLREISDGELAALAGAARAEDADSSTGLPH